MVNIFRLTAILAMTSGILHAQQGIGSVAMQDATVSGDLSVTNGRALLLGSSTIVAKDHTAEVTLNRGGTVRVCATSGLHLAQTQGSGAQPLLLALDRGSIEVHTAALANDVVMTPDLRFTLRAAGPLDLNLRVTRNGDTCVENKGATAPILSITDTFGDTFYELRPNQHVLFEHGSLKEVVDNETSPCGCPAEPAPISGNSVAEQHPFPAAVSEGLAPPPPPSPTPAGVVHAQVATTLGYTGDGSGTIAGTPAPPPPPPAPQHPGFAHRIGHFFKHLFGSS